MNGDGELLVGLSDGELEALSVSLLTAPAQTHLDELLARNARMELTLPEQEELDRLLERIDHLTVLKTRARYTLNRQNAGATPR